MCRKILIFLKVKIEFTVFCQCIQLHGHMDMKKESVSFKFICYANWNYSASFLYGVTSLVAICIYRKNTWRNSNVCSWKS